jgi:hypothetical protein
MRRLRLWSWLIRSFEERRQAERRAYELLCAHLTASQLAAFQAFGRFDVIGGDSGRRYVIRDAAVLNVDEMDKKGECATVWCFAPAGDLAQGDVLLAQKIALESFESEALRLARAHYFTCTRT